MFLKSVLLGLKKKIGEPIMILLTVAIAVATFVSALSLRDSIERTAIASYRALAGDAEWEATLSDDYLTYYLTGDSEEYLALRQESEKYGSLYAGYLFYASLGKGSGEGRFAEVYATDPAELTAYNSPKLSSGRMPQGATDVVLSASFAKKIGAEVGTFLYTSRYGSDKAPSPVQVVGIAEAEGLFTEADVLVTEIVAGRLLGDSDNVRVYNRFFIDLSDEKMKAQGVNPSMAKEAILAAAPAFSVDSPVKEENVKVTLSHQSILLFVIAIIVAALGAVLIYTAVSLVMKNRVSVAALFKSVGATGGTLTLYLLSEILLYGIVGSFLGIASSYGVGAIFRAMTGMVTGFSVGSGAFFAGLGFGIGLSLLSALIPVIRLATAPLYDMLHAQTPILQAKKLPVLITGVLFLVFFLWTAFAGVDSAFAVGIVAAIFLLAFLFAVMPFAVKGIALFLCRYTRNAPRAGKIYLAASGAKANRHAQSGARLLAIAIAAVISVAVLLGEANHQLVTFENLFRADIMISASGKEIKEITEEVASEEGVSGAYVGYVATRCVVTGEAGNTVSILAARGEEFEQVFRAADYGVKVSEIRGERKIAMGGGLAMKLGLSVGDPVEITVDGSPVTFTLASLIDTPLTVIFTDLDGLGIDPNTCFVKGGSEVYSHLSQKYALRGAVYYASDTFGYVTDLASAYIKVFGLFEILVFLFAAAGYLNTALAAHRDRKREYELLAASGASRGDLRRIVTAENAIVTGAALLVGGALSVALLYIVQNMLKSLGLYFTLLG